MINKVRLVKTSLVMDENNFLAHFTICNMEKSKYKKIYKNKNQCLFYITSGQVRFYIYEDGKDKTLFYLNKGSYFRDSFDVLNTNVFYEAVIDTDLKYLNLADFLNIDKCADNLKYCNLILSIEQKISNLVLKVLISRVLNSEKRNDFLRKIYIEGYKYFKENEKANLSGISYERWRKIKKKNL